MTPGEAFDAPGFLRISYATSLERLREGVTRLLDFVQKLDAAGRPRRPSARERLAAGADRARVRRRP